MTTTLLPTHRDRLSEILAPWRQLTQSTQPIERDQARLAITNLYRLLGYPPPTVLFCSSPEAIASTFTKLLHQSVKHPWQVARYTPQRRTQRLQQCLGPCLRTAIEELRQTLETELDGQLSWDMQMILEEDLRQPLQEPVYTWQLWEHLHETEPQLAPWIAMAITPETMLDTMAWNQFCIEVLGCRHSASIWAALQAMVQSCGWILPFEQVCIVCDRPRQLHTDAQGRLHGEGYPALQFADGSGVYAYQGVRLPKRYGQHHPHQWRAPWVLKEANAALRRILMQGIGYGRLCQELGATELDQFQEYVLLELELDLKSDLELEEEPILLLKMTCPSTGFIYIVRVPPDMESAREAARWMNWDVDPTEFAHQS